MSRTTKPDTTVRTDETSTSSRPTTIEPAASNWWRDNWVWFLVAICLIAIAITVAVAIFFCWKKQLFCFKTKKSGYQRGTGVEMRYSKENDNIYLRKVFILHFWLSFNLEFLKTILKLVRGWVNSATSFNKDLTDWPKMTSEEWPPSQFISAAKYPNKNFFNSGASE